MLSKKTKYAIKALVALGKNTHNPPMQIVRLAEQEMIPRKFLEQNLQVSLVWTMSGNAYPVRHCGCYQRHWRVRWDKTLHKVLWFSSLLSWVRLCWVRFWFEIFCQWLLFRRMSVSSPIGQVRLPHACVALIYCHTLTVGKHALKTMWTEIISREITGFRFGRLQIYLFVEKHGASVVHRSGRFEE